MNYSMVTLVQTKDVKCVSILKTSHTDYRKEAAFERMHDLYALCEGSV